MSRYFIIEGTTKQPLPLSQEEMKKAIAEHLVFLQRGFDEGWMLLSGPKAQGGGGVILMKAESLESVTEYLSKDPLLTSGTQDYKIVEFKLHDCQQMLKTWFE